MTEFENVLPEEIEKRSFEIIAKELSQMGIVLDEEEKPIIMRAIHTAADFDYAKNMVFSDGATKKAIKALEEGCTIVTDTQMAKAGINKAACKKLGVNVECFIADEDVKEAAIKNGTTRSNASMEKACNIEGNVIFVIGNAPTALIKLYDLIEEGRIKPALIIGVPVGFVNVTQSKELIMKAHVPYIVARGRKGGSNVAAAIVNALLYKITRK